MKNDKEVRTEISGNSSLTDILVLLSEGNPGALNVLANVIQTGEDGVMIPLHLDDMNIRGSQIWVGFKDYCKQDIEAFMKAVCDRDEKMVEVINKVGLDGNHSHKAVGHGASFGKREFL